MGCKIVHWKHINKCDSSIDSETAFHKIQYSLILKELPKN
jgi:hypothetical protein